METKSDIDWLKMVRGRYGFQESHIVPSNGSSGGLALFWQSRIKVEVLGSSVSHIDSIIDEGNNFARWRLTGFYGNPETFRRVESWQLLHSLSTMSPLPWVVIGDFNEIRLDSEKEGGVPRPKQQMARFNSVINSCGLQEVDFIGPKFTWLFQRSDGFKSERGWTGL